MKKLELVGLILRLVDAIEHPEELNQTDEDSLIKDAIMFVNEGNPVIEED